MFFYKFDGTITDEKWIQACENRNELQKRTRKLCTRSEEYNQKLQWKSCFYVTDASDEILHGGILSRDLSDLSGQLNAYLKALKIRCTDISLEETTFKATQSMLCSACRRDYILNDDDILERFELDDLANRYSGDAEFTERILDPPSQTDIYTKARSLLIKDELLCELDRIYGGKSEENAKGHPVHYMIQTDDPETLKTTSQLLLQSLYDTGRTSTRRYSRIRLQPDMDMNFRGYDCLYKSCSGGAVLVQYAAGSAEENGYASSDRRILEAMCRTMKKYRHQVLTVFALPRECTQIKDLLYANLGTTSFVELKEDMVYGEKAKSFLEQIVAESKVQPDQQLFSMLEEEKGYLAPDLHSLFERWYDKKLKTEIYPQYRSITTIKEVLRNAVPKGSAYTELMEMIGLADAKAVIRKALDYFKAQKLFADRGMSTSRPSMHMVFSGNPGTAKTTAARLVARILQENQILSRGHLIEVGRGDLVGKFVGWTAPNIQKKFKEAAGGVLFIDEAYSLTDDHDGSFGDEAINTIVQEMENHRTDVVVIFAGYPDKMEMFIQRNPGLRSRIAFHVSFADYTSGELCDIACLQAKKIGLTFTEEAREKLNQVFDLARLNPDFGNGRYVRNVIEKARMAQAARLLKKDYDQLTQKEITTLCEEDIELPATAKVTRFPIGFAC